MNKPAEASGLWLLSIYTLLVIASFIAAIALMFTAERIVPSFSDIIFVIALGAALIGPWFVAVWLADKIAMTGTIGAGAPKR